MSPRPAASTRGKQSRRDSYRINYSKRFDTTGVSSRFASYRYSDSRFLSYARFLEKDRGNAETEKQTLSITASQYIPALSLNLYFGLQPDLVGQSPPPPAHSTVGYNFDLGR